jgi:hypothetical protein
VLELLYVEGFIKYTLYGFQASTITGDELFSEASKLFTTTLYNLLIQISYLSLGVSLSKILSQVAYGKLVILLHTIFHHNQILFVLTFNCL